MKKKILIIDDTEDIAVLMQTRLEAHGYDVILASDGGEGVTKAVEYLPDLILLDICMPHVDGYTFLHNIKNVTAIKGIPIVVMTSKPQMKDLFAVEGISDFLTKPIEAPHLLEVIEKHLRKKNVKAS